MFRNKSLPLLYTLLFLSYISYGYLVINTFLWGEIYEAYLLALTLIVLGYHSLNLLNWSIIRLSPPHPDFLNKLLVILAVYLLFVGLVIHEGRWLSAFKYGTHIVFFLVARKVLFRIYGEKILSAYALLAFGIGVLVVIQACFLMSGIVNLAEWKIDIDTFLGGRGVREDAFYYNPLYLGFVRDYEITLFGTTLHRYAGYTTEPTYLAGFILPAMIYYWYKMQYDYGYGVRFIITAITLIVSFSLGGYLSLFIGILISIVVSKFRSRKMIVALGMVTVVGYIIITLILASTNQYFQDRLAGFAATVGIGREVQTDSISWFGTWRQDAPPMLFSKLHSVILLSRYGISGLTLYAIFIVGMLLKILDLLQSNDRAFFYAGFIALVAVIKFETVSEVFLPLFMLTLAYAAFMHDRLRGGYERDPVPVSRKHRLRVA